MHLFWPLLDCPVCQFMLIYQSLVHQVSIDILQLIHITSVMQDIAVNACKYFLHIDIQMKYFKMLHFVYNNHLDLWYA